MNVHAPRRYQQGLRDQQQNPARKRRPVNVNDRTRQRRVKYPGHVVRVREAYKHGEHYEQRHARKKEMVVPAPRQTDHKLFRSTGTCYNCGHRASVT